MLAHATPAVEQLAGPQTVAGMSGRHRPAESVPQLVRPIFIVGDGRSGTTLMRGLLSAHSRLAVTPETQYMARADADGPLAAGAPASFDSFWRSYTSWVRFEDLGVDADRCLSLVDLQGERSFKTVFVAVLEAYRLRAGKDRVGEKSPGHIAYLDHLFRWFPDAQVIVLRRDPRAVVASKMQTPWVRKEIRRPSLRTGVISTSRWRAFLDQVAHWERVYERTLPRWQEHPQVMTVSYERLVQHPEEEMRTVCAFLGEPYESTMFTGRSAATVPPPAGETADQRLEKWRRQHEDRALSAVSMDSLEKWRAELSAIEVATIEAQCFTGMRAAGYPPTSSLWLRRAAGAGARLASGAVRAEASALAQMQRLTRRLRR